MSLKVFSLTSQAKLVLMNLLVELLFKVDLTCI